ncbi:MAG: response regulator [Deltaproteobacteria bacterium]|nr:response regulator [Deltaproteobacteria bacterium]
MQSKDEYVPRGRVLAVDDHQHLRWVISKLLSERGHEVRTASTGASALKVISGFDCQVAIVDYRLPDTDGIALILEMKSHLPRLRSILMTSYGNASLCQSAMDENLFAYFDKPFNNTLMIRTVEDAIREHETGDNSLAGGLGARTLFPDRSPSKS